MRPRNPKGIHFTQVATATLKSFPEEMQNHVKMELKELDQVSQADIERISTVETLEGSNDYLMKVPPDVRIIFTYMQDGVILVLDVLRKGGGFTAGFRRSGIKRSFE